MYDLEADPHEVHNIYGKNKNSVLVKKLKEDLNSLIKNTTRQMQRRSCPGSRWANCCKVFGSSNNKIYTIETVCIFFLFIPFFIQAQTVNLIPKPAFVKQENGTFVLNAETKIIVRDNRLFKTAKLFNEYLAQYYGFKIAVVARGEKIRNGILFCK